MVTSTIVIHVQIFIHKLAVVLIAVELRVGRDLAQPSDIREFKRREALDLIVIGLHAGNDEAVHNTIFVVSPA